MNSHENLTYACPFDNTAFTVSWKVWIHTSWMLVASPNDRPISVCNRYVIEIFGDVFVLSLDIFIFWLYTMYWVLAYDWVGSLSIFHEDMQWITVALAVIGKGGAAAAYAVIYIWTAELFPTMLRNVALGAGSFAASGAGILAPYIANLVCIYIFHYIYLDRRTFPYQYVPNCSPGMYLYIWRYIYLGCRTFSLGTVI